MKKFTFKLEPVLQHREVVERQAVLRQARAMEAYDSSLSLLEEARGSLERVSAVPPPGEVVDSFDYLCAALYRERLAEECRRREAEVARAERQLEDCRRAVVDARRDRLVLEKIREKRFAEYRKMLAREDRKVCDEIGTALVLRGKLGEN